MAAKRKAKFCEGQVVVATEVAEKNHQAASGSVWRVCGVWAEGEELYQVHDGDRRGLLLLPSELRPLTEREMGKPPKKARRKP